MEGKPPLFVLEVVTEESFVRDTEEKPAIYERLGVREYAIYAPLPEHGGPRLFGYRRDSAGRWVPWQPNGHDALTSEALDGLTFYVEGVDDLRVRDREARRLPTDTEALEVEVARLRALLRQREP